MQIIIIILIASPTLGPSIAITLLYQLVDLTTSKLFTHNQDYSINSDSALTLIQGNCQHGKGQKEERVFLSLRATRKKVVMTKLVLGVSKALRFA